MTKNKDGVTAGEVPRLLFPGEYNTLFSHPGERLLREKLADGSWYATGLRTPIDPDKPPERIPAYLWDVLEIDYHDNEADGGGLNYIRLRFYQGGANVEPNRRPSAVRPNRRGRKKGTGGYDSTDVPLIEKMHQLINSREAANPWRAALLVVDDAEGTGNADTKIKRLAGKYIKKYVLGEGHSG